ncbi:MAG: hypothetical protein K6T65_01080 [Peptococcaceae bacterium]|nr:hypothetical protein [Peptococcaceae bacterium]
MSEKILSATGVEELDLELESVLPRHGMVLAGTCYHRSALEKVVKETGADTVIISPALAGDKNFVEMVYYLRMAGLRVVVLPGNPQTESAQRTVMEVIPFGVYDFIYDEVKVGDVIDRLLNPGSLGDVPAGIVKSAIESEKLSSKIEMSLPADGDIKRELRLKKSLKGLTKTFFSNGGIRDGQDPENMREKIGYSDDVLQPQKGMALKFAGDIGQNGEGDPERTPGGQAGKVPGNVSGKISREAPGRKRSGRPAAVLAVGDARIEDWIKENFSDQMDVLSTSADPDEVKQRIAELYPDICIIMRHSAIGGIHRADDLAVWAAVRVPAVLFIVGELDGPGKEMADRAAGAGVRHIISCEKGGFISGDELVYVLTSVIREIQTVQPGEEKKEVAFSGEARKAINSLFRGIGRLKVEAEKPKVKKPKIKMRDGLSLEDEASSDAVVVLKNPTSVVPGGILAVVTPWKPNLAGRLAAQAVRILSEVEGSEVAYVGASKNSTGALWLNVSDEELMMSDWRVPGSSFPITQENIKIYAVDPSKDLRVEGETDLWSIVKQARKTATYTVVDFAGDMAAAGKAAHQGRAVLLVVLPGNDPVEYKIASLWFRNLAEGKQNVVTGINLRGSPNGIPEGLRPKVVIRNNPADALASVLKKNNDDEFVWN